MTFLRIAARSLMARRRRSAILIGGIGVGVMGIVFFQVLIEGFLGLFVDSAVNTTMGHIQIHGPDYRVRREVELTIPSPERISSALKANTYIEGYSRRVVVTGLVSSPRNSMSVTVYGIDPDEEATVTSLSNRIAEGENLAAESPAGILIGRALARRLKVRLGDRIVLMARDVDGEMAGAALRVRGLFGGEYEGVELNSVYVSRTLLRSTLLLPEDALHEVAIRVRDFNEVHAARDGLRAALSDIEVEVSSWDDLAPVIRQQMDMSWVSSLVLFSIVFSAVVFGVFNAFMMEIFERIHEFGVVMSLGTTPFQVFRMVVYEGVLLGAAGAVVGAFGAWGVIELILGGRLDLSRWAAGMGSFGAGADISLKLHASTIVVIVTISVLVAFLATLYPAARASRFRPVEAIRYVD